MNKNDYKQTIDSIKASEAFKKNTHALLITELETQKNIDTHKEVLLMNNRKKTVLKWTTSIAACLTLVIVIGALALNPKPKSPDTQPPTTESPALVGKVIVNIDGQITEVNKEENSFKIGNLWVVITPATTFGITDPNGESTLIDKEFKVGNIVSGYTTDDTTTNKVTATTIYNNFPEN